VKALGYLTHLRGTINRKDGPLDFAAKPTQVNVMAYRRPETPTNKPAPQKRQSFRQRYDELESRRIELSVRLQSLGDSARKHPGYKRALTLLNEIYRREKLPQRVAVLQSAAWLIDILEKLAGSL
jgi:hypothetical protein